MDWSFVHALNAFLAGHDGVEDPLVAYEGAAEVLFVLLLAGLVLLGGRALRRAAVAALASAGVALALAQVTTRLVDRPRPFVTHPGAVHLFATHAADPGFPSDHATASFAIATALVLRDRRCGVLALAMAVALAVGRVAMGVHYPTDVAAGAALGAAVALALHRAAAARALDAFADRLGALRGAGRRRLAR